MGVPAVYFVKGALLPGPASTEKALYCETDGTWVQVSPGGTKAPINFDGYKRGADLGNADATIQPFTDNASIYVLPAATMTANRTLTLGNTSAPGAGIPWNLIIVRLDLTAFTLAIKKADATTIYTDPISPTQNRALQFACTNGVWAPVAGWIIP